MQHALDVINYLAVACPDTRMLLPHGTGTAMMGLYGIVCCDDHLMLDLFLTTMRYLGSDGLDAHIDFLFNSTVQLVTIGSDFSEYIPAAVLRSFQSLCQGVEPHRIDTITHRNLERLFQGYRVPGSVA